MELEFDKEIDAILRKPRPNRGVLVGDDPAKKHLDADAISAFAENALPQKAKLLYMEHFADCDRCRKQLSQTILLNTAAGSTTASVVSAPIPAPAVPLYQRLFRTQNLALAMGALVLTFSGVLGYLVLQNSRNAENATVSQVPKEEDRLGVPIFGGEAATANSNAAVNPSATPALPSAPAAAANTSANTAAASSNTTVGTFGRAEADPAKPVVLDDKNVPGRDVDNRPKEAKTEAAPPPPPPAAVTTDALAGAREDRKLAAERQAEPKDLELAKRKYDEDRRGRDVPAAASKGPSRSGPLQNQSNQVNNRAYDMPVTRVVGGKSFNNRDGAWYDSAYRNQATINHRRGTEDYKKLDKGLRNIADTLGGTVVVVWSGKAYRIQ